jgi:hypothetical protein
MTLRLMRAKAVFGWAAIHQGGNTRVSKKAVPSSWARTPLFTQRDVKDASSS